MSNEHGGGDLERGLVFALRTRLGAYLRVWFAQWFMPRTRGFLSVGRVKEPQMTSRLSRSLALLAPPTEDLVELFKRTEGKRYLVCQ